MTSTQPLTASERYARSILTAWNQRELSDLKTTLAHSPALAPAALCAEERERMDLLNGLSQELLLWDAGAGNLAAQNAALAVVRHLARCGQSAR
jgi:hypothetical protein